MDLAIGAKRVWVMMTLRDKQGRPKIVPECTYPLTGVGCIDRVYTDLGTFAVGSGGLRIRDLHGTTAEELGGLLGPVKVGTDQ
jgi:3-oxoadipate CoA-transferase, beta subunit